MKKKQFLRVLGAGLILTAAIGVQGCKREVKSMLKDDDLQFEDEQSEFVETDADNISEAASVNQSGSMRLSGETEFQRLYNGCAIITYDTLNQADIDTITVDFGNGCQGADGRIRKGKLIIKQTGKIYKTGSVRTVNFENYFVNDTKIEGERVITNSGKNSAGQTYWTIEAKNMKATLANGKIRTWNSNRTRTIIAGESTETRMDNVFSIEGAATGISGNNENFTRTITSPLIKSVDCNYIRQGAIKTEVSGKPGRVIDFGDGTCDNQATVTIRNKTRTITLR